MWKLWQIIILIRQITNSSWINTVKDRIFFNLKLLFNQINLMKTFPLILNNVYNIEFLFLSSRALTNYFKIFFMLFCFEQLVKFRKISFLKPKAYSCAESPIYILDVLIFIFCVSGFTGEQLFGIWTLSQLVKESNG